MARYQVVIAYDGTEFYGFQRQADSLETRTVQGAIEAALRQIGWQGRSIQAAGRTDTGVHASGQVIAFDLGWKHSNRKLMAALNANLPQDIAVRAVQEAKADFHPRYDARERCYRYQIYCQQARDPLRDRYAWRVWPQADLGRMKQCAEYLPGSHDFCAFGTPPRPGGTTIREVIKAEWRQSQGGLEFEVIANAFLYHMVRRLVSYQVSIGQSKQDANGFRDLLDGSAHALVQGLAPPQGLTLVDVQYPEGTSLAK